MGTATIYAATAFCWLKDIILYSAMKNGPRWICFRDGDKVRQKEKWITPSSFFVMPLALPEPHYPEDTQSSHFTSLKRALKNIILWPGVRMR